MKMKVEDLSNGALIWAMNRVLEKYRKKISYLEYFGRRHFGDDGWKEQLEIMEQERGALKWFIAGPIIERERITLAWQPQFRGQTWEASYENAQNSQRGMDPLVTGMSCFVMTTSPDLLDSLPLNTAVGFCENEQLSLAPAELSESDYAEKCRKRLFWTFAGALIEQHGMTLYPFDDGKGKTLWCAYHMQSEHQDFSSEDPSSLVIQAFIAAHQASVTVPDDVLRKDAEAIAQGRLIDMEYVSVTRSKPRN